MQNNQEDKQGQNTNQSPSKQPSYYLDNQRKQSEGSESGSQNYLTIPSSVGKNSPLHSDFYTIKPEESSMRPQESESIKDQELDKYSDEDLQNEQLPTFNPNKFLKDGRHKISEDYTPDDIQTESNVHKQPETTEQKPRLRYRSSLKEAVDLKKSKEEEDIKAKQATEKKQQLSPKVDQANQKTLKTKSNESPTQKKKEGQKTKTSSNTQKQPKNVVQQYQHHPVLQASLSQSPQKKSPGSPVIKNKKKVPTDRLQIRKIPNQLYGSYDELNLSVDRMNLPSRFKQKEKKEKEKPQEKPQQLQPINEEMFATLPILEGYCCIKPTPSSDSIETKFVIIKNMVVFQTFKRIEINKFKKIKFLIKDKDEEVFVKINYENQENSEKDHVILVNILSKSEATYFDETFTFFSQLVIRKLLLINLFINEVTQKQESEEQGSYTYEAELFKKAQFFSSWQKRKLSLKNNLLQSFKGNKCTYQIGEVTQLWTRFQMVNGYFVIKMWHKLQKVQLGIPLMDFTNIKGKHNWLYGLARLVANV